MTMNLRRRVAKFRENQCRDGGQRVFGENKNFDAKCNGCSLSTQRATIKTLGY